MGARTGSEFLAGLRKPREIWVGDDRVADVVSHPAFAGAAQTLAQLFDLQHQAADDLPDAGLRNGRADQREPPDPALARRPRAAPSLPAAYRRVHRRPDGANSGLHERHVRRLRRSRRRMGRRTAATVAPRTSSTIRSSSRRKDISLTHTIVHPTIDKATGDAPAPGNDVALHKVAETEHGIVVRGARILATLAPFADELAVYPAHPLPEGADAYALSFCIPMGTPGLKFLCRDSCRLPPTSSTVRCRAASTSRTRS